DEASNGRAYLGIARGGWLDYLELEPRHGVTALREAFACVRHLLQQAKEPLPGKVFSLAGGDSLRWPILRPDVPFLLGSWGAQTIRACINAIDELKIGGSANPDVIPVYRELLDTAAQAAGRQRLSVAIAMGAVTVVDHDGAAARALARREVALYLPVVAALDATVEIEPDRLQRLRTAAANYDFDAAAALVSDALLRRFAFAGTPDQVAEQAHALFAAGAQRVEFGTPHGIRAAEGLRLLGAVVLPALQQAGLVEPLVEPLT
ncbi:MAG: LLM class flavin-dependent oxidoreductase, partial [Litorilinea sp.]